MKTPATLTPAAPANLPALAASLAAALPGQWSVADFQTYPRSDGEFTVTRVDGLALYVVAGGYGNAGRMMITHSRPRTAKGEWLELRADKGGGRIATPAITVSLAKDAEAIAGDITRRLLPDAERVNALALARVNENREYEDHKLALLRECATAAGLPDVPRDHYSKEPTFSFYVTDKPGEDDRATLASVDICGSQVQIKVDAKPGQAAALIAFLRSLTYLTLATAE